MKVVAYYEGDDTVKDWLGSLLVGFSIEYRRLPIKNDSNAFTELPSYVSDILYLDKPDIILAGSIDGVHERPIFSIEFAGCTPQYQHALQRFSRMMASVVNGCPSIIIIPKIKRENSGGPRKYRRSKAVEYGAVRLMDIYGCPAFVFDWPEVDGILEVEDGMSFPKLKTGSVAKVGELLREAIDAFANADYVAALRSKPIIRELTDSLRVQAYENGVPTIDNPGGGDGASTANLELVKTCELIKRIGASAIPSVSQLLAEVPASFRAREYSLIFRPTRITAHAGDPYVGMIGYYDIAFCRVGVTPRERIYNLVAYAEEVEIKEVTSVMTTYNKDKCPLTSNVDPKNIKQYGYHLRNGCKHTKSKPVRIYSELADLIVFKDGLIF